MKGLIRIGDFARLGGVSVKALRFYDDQGLLRPEHIDPHTGYRYYDIAQARRLAMITNLRMVDFSIAEIAALLDKTDATPGAFENAITDKRRALERARSDLANKITITDLLANASATEATPRPAIKLTEMPDRRVFEIRKTVAHLGAPVTEMFETAEAEVARYGARANASPFLIFHTPPNRTGALDLQVCIPVIDDRDTALASTMAPGSPLACAVVYAGGYFKTEALFEEMNAWLARAGVTAAGPLREVYHRFGAEQDDYKLPAKMIARDRTQLLTELQIPITVSPKMMETD